MLRPDLERFLAKVVKKPNGCWEWKATIDKDGYGSFWDGTYTQSGRHRKARAHRWSYEHYRGLIPPDLMIDHLCRNRACVNPEHLEAITGRVNILRGESPYARRARSTSCIQGHTFDAANTRYRKNGTRQCRRCSAISCAIRAEMARAQGKCPRCHQQPIAANRHLCQGCLSSMYKRRSTHA
jgi:hypothetical protein